MQKFILIVVLIIVIAIISFFTGDWIQKPSNITGLQSCPDEKIINQMPGPGGPKPSYYIVNGERKEISEYDAAWVAANCSVPEQTVY